MFFLPGTQAKLWKTIIEERKAEIVENFVCDTLRVHCQKVFNKVFNKMSEYLFMWSVWQNIYNKSQPELPPKNCTRKFIKKLFNMSIGETNIKSHEKCCRAKFTNVVQKHYISNGNSEIPCQYSCVKCPKFYDNKKSL